jgi:hypothetical protein
MWLYKGEEFTSEMIEEWVGFVYLLTDLENEKKYVGKKNFWSTRRLPPLKGKTRRRTKKTESNWGDYYGSSEEIGLLVENSGRSRFRREILHLCESKGVMSYLELKEQMDRQVLLDDEYYNGIVQVKIHRSHVQSLKNR